MKTYDCDVLVVGYGGAGAAAAIEAHDAGAKVILLEKSGAGGGNTKLSGGTLRDIADIEEATKYYAAVNDETVSYELNRKFVELTATNHQWFIDKCDAVIIESKKVLFPPAPHVIWPFLPGADGIGGRSFIDGDPNVNGGTNMAKAFCHGVEKRNIQVMFHTAGKKLIQNENKEITGIIAIGPEGEIQINTKQAVILTCGGFQYNKEMQINYLSIPYVSQGCLGNDGDGITMCQDVRAEMWHMTGLSCGISYRVPDFEIPIGIGVRSPHYFYVDQYGKRFLNETGIDVHAMAFEFTAVDHMALKYPRLPAFLIFDEHVRESGPMTGHCPGQIMEDPNFKWSQDNQTEIEKGWIKMGWTVAELGQKLGFQFGLLEDAVAKYNLASVIGHDSEFGRSALTMGTLNKPPFYGIEVWPSLLNTQGGPKFDLNANVIDIDGNPIKRLYKAGELGSMFNKFYPGAGNISEALGFGRLAGQNAAKEKPLK